MITNLALTFIRGLISALPVVSLPSGASAALSFLSAVIGYVNVFVPLARLAPIFLFVVLVRNFRIVVAGVRFLLYFIPFFG